VLLEKLAEFPRELELRNEVANRYSHALKDKFKTPFVPEGYVSSWAQYTIIDEDRDAIMAYLKSSGVPTMVYYSKCMHQQTAFINLTEDKYAVEIAEELSQSAFSLPMHPYVGLIENQVVVSAMRALKIDAK
jgi:dTDP-4-amino-4,6-dideoxygalactose transaminase